MPRKQNGQSQVICDEIDVDRREESDADGGNVAESRNTLRDKCDSGVTANSTVNVQSLRFSTTNNNKKISMKKEDVLHEVEEAVVKERIPKRKVEAPVDVEASDLRMPKRGRPRKAYVFPVVVSAANNSSLVSANVENAGVSASNVETGDLSACGGSVSTTKVRHDNERTCHVCGKYYWKPSDLQRHLYKHTGERRFSCPICDQFFSCKRNMQYHQRAVHGLAIELSPGLDKKWKRRSYYFRAIEALKAAGGVQTLPNGLETNGEVDGDHSTPEVITSEAEDQTVENRLAHVKASGVDSSVTETEDDSSNCEVFVSVEDGENSDVGEFKIDTMTEEILVSRSKGVNTSSGESTFVYKCHLCEKMYVSIDRLHSHFVEHLEALKPDDSYVCDICGELFNTKYDLKVHLEDHPAVDDELSYEPETILSEEEYSANSDGHDDLPSLLSPETLSDMAHASLALPVLEEGGSNATIEINDEGWRPGGFKCKKEVSSSNAGSPITLMNNDDVADSVRRLLSMQARSEDTVGETDDQYENGLASSLLESEQEDIVIKVEPPGYSDEEEELPPPPVEPLLVITGSPKMFSRKGRGKTKKKLDDEEKSNASTSEDVSPSAEAVDETSLQNVKKGSHISKYTPRLPIIDKPERVKVIHPRRMEDGMIVFPCCYCDKVFTSTSDVHRHMNFHEDIRPYKCNQCHYYSRTTSQLKVHMMRHKGIKKYFCEPCNYYGVTQSDVNRHKKSQAHFARLAESEEGGVGGNSNLVFTSPAAETVKVGE